jgi:hypothetical protein
MMPATGPGSKRSHWFIGTFSLRAILAALTLVAATGCGTMLTPLPAGEAVHIEPDQGVLVVETWSNSDIERLLLAGPDKSLAVHSLEKLPSGRHVHLVTLPAGEYRWSRIELPGSTFRGRMYPVFWDLANSEEWRLSVRAGQVNYPGALILRRSAWSYLSYRLLNRSGELLDSLEELFPDLLSQYPVRYAGSERDDFLGFYHSELQSRAPREQSLEEDDPIAPGEL